MIIIINVMSDIKYLKCALEGFCHTIVSHISDLTEKYGSTLN